MASRRRADDERCRPPREARGELAPYRQSIDTIAAALGTDLRCGITDADAQVRLARDGAHALTSEPTVPAWRRVLAQFRDVLVLLLLAATAISAGLWAYERDAALPYEALAILAVVLLNATLGYVQEARAEAAVAALRAMSAAVAALRAMSAAEASVIRAGARRRVPAADLVTGDGIVVEEGDTIPADARVVESTALQVAEAALTGESLPVSKAVPPIAGVAALGDRHNMLFSGTAATYGRGRAVVTATGMQTEMGASRACCRPRARRPRRSSATSTAWASASASR